MITANSITIMYTNAETIVALLLLRAQRFYLVALAMATLPGLLGNHGLWLSVMIFMVVRALTLAVRYPKIESAVAANPA